MGDPAQLTGINKPSASTILSVCLLAAKASRENGAFQKIIHDIAAKNDKSAFLPHFTLANLPGTTDPDRVTEVIFEMKDEIFSSHMSFDEMEISPVGFAILGKSQNHKDLIDLQKRFHEKLGETPNVAAFPHMALGYMEAGQLESLKELEEKGLYKQRSPEEGGGLELAGFHGFSVGGLYAAHTGGFDPSQWKIFLRIDKDDQEDI